MLISFVYSRVQQMGVKEGKKLMFFTTPFCVREFQTKKTIMLSDEFIYTFNFFPNSRNALVLVLVEEKMPLLVVNQSEKTTELKLNKKAWKNGSSFFPFLSIIFHFVFWPVIFSLRWGPLGSKNDLLPDICASIQDNKP